MKTRKSATHSLRTLFGPLWKFYSDDSVRTICVDSFDDVYCIKGDESKVAPRIFKSPDDLNRLAAKLIIFSGRELDQTSKSVIISIDDHTKIMVVMPPVAIKGPSILVNKLHQQEVNLADLVKFNALEKEGKGLIEDCIEKAKGILVAGNLRSGRTTLLNALVTAIPLPRRVVTIEKQGEFSIKRKKVCRLQMIHQRPEELLELIAIAERMSPDYVVISNFEGVEVMPFLEMARSHGPAFGSIIGENPMDALKRLETKAVLSSEGMSLEEVRYEISQSFHYVVFQEKREDGKRLVSSISEIRYESGEIKLKSVYKK